MKGFLICYLLCWCSWLSGQVSDDFSDGNFQNPLWLGDTLDFVQTASGELQLRAMGSGNSQIFTAVQLEEEFEISTYFRLEFAPSNSNHLAIYLLIDTLEVEVANGYVVRIGENGSDDSWKLFEIIQGQEKLLSEGQSGLFGDNPASASIRAFFRANELQLDIIKDKKSVGTYSTDFSSIMTSGYLGISCNYTTTRADKFYFDNVYAGTIIPDTIPPIVQQIIVSDHALKLTLSEPIDTTSIQLIHFSVTPEIGEPSRYRWNADSLSLTLEFDQPFISNTPYSLEFQGIQDLSGNIAPPTIIPFESVVFESIQLGDLVISEVLVDPSPSQGLPEEEFIELFNNSEKRINLQGLMIIVNDRNTFLPAQSLDPYGYVVLCKSSDTSVFSPYGTVLGLEDFPIIRNGAGSVTLISMDQQVLHHLNYGAIQTQATGMEDGGWSFEIINPNLYCEGSTNWSFSKNEFGGTPGAENSVHDALSAGQPLSLQALWADDTAMHFTLSHYLYDLTSEEASVLFEFENLLIDSVQFLDRFNQRGIIAVPLSPQTIYSVQLNPTLATCSLIESDITYQVGIGHPPALNDVQINEVLFNPKGNGADYVEIVNTSDAILNIQSLIVKNELNDRASDPLQYNFSFLPGAYLCLTTDKFNIIEQFDSIFPEKIHEINLPSLPNTEGNVSLIQPDPGEMIINQMNYTESMHSEFIDNPDGVALEKISIHADGLNPNNWYSASVAVHFGTPTLPNSQYFENDANQSIHIELVDRVMNIAQPDENPFFILEYSLDAPGYIVNVDIFSLQGLHMNTLYHQFLLGTSGELQWNGHDNNQQMVPNGMYIILLEGFQPEGKFFRKKLSCVVANN